MLMVTAAAAKEMELQVRTILITVDLIFATWNLVKRHHGLCLLMPPSIDLACWTRLQGATSAGQNSSASSREVMEKELKDKATNET